MLAVDTVAGTGDRERATFLQQSLDLGECRVYSDGEVVAGYIVVRLEHFFGRDFVELLMVDPARRRSGIGRILLRQALATARTARVFISTNTSNQPMQSLLAAEHWSEHPGARHLRRPGGCPQADARRG